MLRTTFTVLAAIAFTLAFASDASANQFDEAAKAFPNPKDRKVYTFFLVTPQGSAPSVRADFVKEAVTLPGAAGFAGSTIETILRLVSREKEKVKKADVEKLAKKHKCTIDKFTEHKAETALLPLELPWTAAEFDAYWTVGRKMVFSHSSTFSSAGEVDGASKYDVTSEVLSVTQKELEYRHVSSGKGAQPVVIKRDPAELKELHEYRAFRCDVTTTKETIMLGGAAVRCTVYFWTNDGSGHPLYTRKIWVCQKHPGVVVKSETVHASSAWSRMVRNVQLKSSK